MARERRLDEDGVLAEVQVRRCPDLAEARETIARQDSELDYYRDLAAARKRAHKDAQWRIRALAADMQEAREGGF